ncbi:hypothetical protein [Thermophilibacter provencensis]|uniref:hypothetical protein n=1 Tax=Thermophilibacter provencensis TaxID=1852386 RepID=UPI0023543AA8|nr:hypothetical protein [Thermophilibacter provencensis]
MRKKARERLKDFGLDDNGKMAYLGDHVRLAGGQDRRRLVVTLWAACGLAVVAVVGASLANPAGLSGCPYVVLPYIAQFVSMVAVLWGMGRFSVGGERVRVYVRDETVGALPRRCVVAAALGLVAAAGEVVLLATSGTAPAAADFAFLACEAVSVVALVTLRRACLDTAWEPA